MRQRRGSTSEEEDVVFYDCTGANDIHGEKHEKVWWESFACRTRLKKTRFLRWCGQRKEPPVTRSSNKPQQATSKPRAPSSGITCPTLDALSEKKVLKIEEMRQRLAMLPEDKAPPHRHDIWLKRYLAHGKWDLDKSVQLYTEMEAWRREVGAERILEDSTFAITNRVLPIDLVGMYPYSYDRLGRVVTWMRVGHVPWWRSLFERTPEAFQAQLWLSERYLDLVEKKAQDSGVMRERAVVIVDLGELDLNYFKGLSGSSRARKRGTMQSCAKYYPGLVDKAYIVNAPGFANKAWTILKLFLSQELMDKAELITNDSDRATMLDALGVENIPRCFGGESDRATYPLPEHLMMPETGWASRLEAWRPQEVVIGTGSEHVEVRTLPPGAHIEWRWGLADLSIFFTVTHLQADDASETVVVEKSEVSGVGDAEPVHGTFDSPSGGKVRFVWDNTQSRVRSKTIFLRLSVSPPEASYVAPQLSNT